MSPEDEHHPPHDRREKDHWSLDKRVPLALIVAIVIQTMGVVWWTSWWTTKITGEHETMGRRLEVLENERTSVRIAERLAVLEAQMSATNITLGKLEGYLRRLEDRNETIDRRGHGSSNGRD